jgi:photosystem II stability/assembly factor-like uncharacterized protein
MRRTLNALLFLLFIFPISVDALPGQPAYRQLLRHDLKFLKDSEIVKAIRSDRARFFNQQRSYPFEAYLVERQREAQLEVWKMWATATPQNLDLPEWEALGPGNIGGRLNAIALNPMNDDVIYVGGVSSGVWETTNGGVSWEPLTDSLPSLSIGALAVDPLDPDVIYAGTGEENFIGQYGCKPYRSDMYPGAGVFKSTDGGDTWNQAGEFFSESMCRIAIHPMGTDTLFIASVDGIFKSIDGGDSWSVAISGVATDVMIDPDTHNIVYAVIGKPDGDPANGVYKSTDTGETWELKSNGLPDPQQMGRIMLAMAPSSNENQWIYANVSYIYAPLGVYLTKDGGESWTHTGFSDVGDCYKNATIADPLDSLTAYTGGLELFKTTDAGSTWTEITTWWEEIYPYDNQLMQWGSDLTTLFNVSDRGVMKSTDGGWNWIDLDNQLEITQFQSVALHPTDRSIGIGGTQDRGTLLYTGDTQNWEQIYPADGGVTVIDYDVPTTIFTEYVYLSIMKSTNMGVDWERAEEGIDQNDDVGFYAPYVMDPNNHLKMYAGTDRIYKTLNGADLWVSVSDDLTKDMGFYVSYISAIEVSKHDSNFVYVGTSDGNFHTSMDGGDSWMATSLGLPNRHVMDIAIDPDDAEHVYVVFSGYDTTHVWESTLFGMVWNDISSNLPDVPVNTIVLPTGEFKNPGTIYIGTDFSCFKTTDNGASWFPFKNGLPNTVIEDMAFHETLGFIRVATQGRSTFEVVDTTAATIVVEETPGVPRVFSLEQNYPNPFNPQTTISYTLEEDGHVILKVYNIKGQLVATLQDDRQNKGDYHVALSGKDLSSGVYFYRIKVKDLKGNIHTKTRKLLVVK